MENEGYQEMVNIIFICVTIFLILGLVVCVGIIRGFLRTEKPNGNIRPLTGREIEVLRRRLSAIGIQAITATDVFCLVKTIRDTNLGVWIDSDPYYPADPYEDIDRKV
jgi:hypothetical protein